MDQQIATTIALIEASPLSQVDKDYFVAALKRNGLTPALEKEMQSALKTEQPADDTEDRFVTFENERERRTQELDDQFASRFQALDTQMAALQKEYDDALAALNTEIDQKIDQPTPAL